MNPKALGIINFIQQCRWFRFKSKQLLKAELWDETSILFGTREIHLLLLKLSFSDQTEAIYFMPVEWNKEVVKDVFTDPQFQLCIMQHLNSEKTLLLKNGALHFKKFHSWDKNNLKKDRFKSLSSEQSNSSFIFNNESIVKFYRQVEEGSSCEIEMLENLSLKKFKNIPALQGKITYCSKMGKEYSLGLCSEFFSKSRDGWNYFLSKPNLSLFESLGEATAKMHRLLAQNKDPKFFNSEPISEKDKEKWFIQFQTLLDNLISSLRFKNTFKPELQKRLNLIFFNRDLMLKKAKQLLDKLPAEAQKIRCHGDYHLGQTLRADKEWILLDFEGEPMRPAIERKEKYPPEKDIAGMLRSIDYLTYTLYKNEKLAEKNFAEWTKKARGYFLKGYGQVIKVSERDSTALLKFYELDKVIYELQYELNNRPDWINVPLDGFEKLLPTV